MQLGYITNSTNLSSGFRKLGFTRFIKESFFLLLDIWTALGNIWNNKVSWITAYHTVLPLPETTLWEVPIHFPFWGDAHLKSPPSAWLDQDQLRTSPSTELSLWRSAHLGSYFFFIFLLQLLIEPRVSLEVTSYFIKDFSEAESWGKGLTSEG